MSVDDFWLFLFQLEQRYWKLKILNIVEWNDVYYNNSPLFRIAWRQFQTRNEKFFTYTDIHVLSRSHDGTIWNSFVKMCLDIFKVFFWFCSFKLILVLIGWTFLFCSGHDCLHCYLCSCHPYSGQHSTSWQDDISDWYWENGCHLSNFASGFWIFFIIFWKTHVWSGLFSGQGWFGWSNWCLLNEELFWGLLCKMWWTDVPRKVLKQHFGYNQKPFKYRRSVEPVNRFILCALSFKLFPAYLSRATIVIMTGRSKFISNSCAWFIWLWKVWADYLMIGLNYSFNNILFGDLHQLNCFVKILIFLFNLWFCLSMSWFYDSMN